jgi:hypothetical protein
MTKLSVAAQAVLDAVEDDCIHPSDKHRLAAAALRAAADQVVPAGWPLIEDFNEFEQGVAAAHISHRNALLTIAAELEAQ